MRGVNVALVTRELNENHPAVLFVTTEEETQFKLGKYPDAENAKLFTAYAETIEKQGNLLEMERFLIGKFRTGKLKGDELEVAKRFLKASGSENRE